MQPEEIQTLVLGVLGEIAPEAKTVSIQPDIRFRDQFEFSSVDFLSFIMKLQEVLNIRIPETDCIRLSTLSGCLSYLSEGR